MTNHWKRLSITAFLAAAFAAPPVFPADPSRDGPGSVEKTTAEKLDELKEMMSGLRVKIDKIESAGVNVAKAMEADVKEIKSRLERLEREMDALKVRPATSVSGYNAPQLPAATGRVRLVNTYFDDVRIVVNNQVYPVPRGGERIIDKINPGDLTYEVLGIKPEVRTRIAAGETVAVTVHPQE